MSDVTTTADGPDPAKAADAVAAARAVVAERVAKLKAEWEEEEPFGEEPHQLFAKALGFEEIVILGVGYRREGLFVREREEGDIAPVRSWVVSHEASRSAFPYARFAEIERAFTVALALLYAGVDWTPAGVWTDENVRAVTALVLRPFVEEEAVAAAKRAHELAGALYELDALAAWVEGERPEIAS